MEIWLVGDWIERGGQNISLYHVLAVVHLIGEDNEIYLDDSRVFLIPQTDVAKVSTDCKNLGDYEFSRETRASFVWEFACLDKYEPHNAVAQTKNGGVNTSGDTR